jgi:predicted O-linked N-acetylglucosamine transferase (SPINDLY family)
VSIWYSGEDRDASVDYVAKHAHSFEHVNEDALVTAAKIHAAELDVLIYPEIGMTPGITCSARFVSLPCNVSFYGHPVTSGLRNIDYFVSGTALEPPGAAAHYRESLVLLPGLGGCPERPPAAGSGAWLDPSAKQSHCSFACKII